MLRWKIVAAYVGLVVLVGCATMPVARTFPLLPADSGLEWIKITVKGME